MVDGARIIKNQVAITLLVEIRVVQARVDVEELQETLVPREQVSFFQYFILDANTLHTLKDDLQSVLRSLRVCFHFCFE